MRQCDREEVRTALEEMREAFVAFRGNSPEGARRRYSEELKELARVARRQGASGYEISQASGVTVSTLMSWFGPSAKVRGLRKLKVVGEAGGVGVGSVAAVVILPSGVRIEIGALESVGGQFLRELSLVGRSN